MNTLQIDYFLMAADSGSFTAAAQRLYVSQPAVSRAVAALEKELGCVLFDRRERKALSLTPGGKLFYDLLRQERQSLSDTIQAAQKLSGTETGTFRIGIQAGLDAAVLSPVISGELAQRYPGISAETVSYDFRELRAALLSGRIDGAVAMEDSLYPLKDIRMQPLQESPRLLVYARRHPLAAAPPLTAVSFREAPFLVVEDVHSELLVSQYCKSYGFRPRVVPVPNVESMVMGIRSMQGVGVMDGLTQVRNDPEFGWIQMDSVNRIVLAWLTYCRNPLLSVFTRALSPGAGGIHGTTKKQRGAAAKRESE